MRGPWTTSSAGWNNKSFTIGYFGRPVVAWEAFNRDGAGRQSYPNGAMPRLSRMRNVAIFTENLDAPYGDPRLFAHGEGLNVIYADGAGAFVPAHAIDTNLRAAHPTAGTYNNASYLSGTYPQQTGLWADFDQAR